MKINKDKSVGQVLFIVEGGKTEFSLLRNIFCNILGYAYIEKRRGKESYFQSRNISTSRIAVINPEESNISDIQDENQYLEKVISELLFNYNFPVDKAAIYYLFDRDLKSNLDITLINKLISDLGNPYENGQNRGGLLLFSYPSIEGYTINSFINDSYKIGFELGTDAKRYIGSNKSIQLNKLSYETIQNAALELLKYLDNERIELNIENFRDTNIEIFQKQEGCYSGNKFYRLISLLSIAFLQLQIIEIE